MPHVVWYTRREMNEVQSRIVELESKGWTLAAIARELKVSHSVMEKWKAGDRHARLEKLVIDALSQLLTRQRIPKKRHYQRKQDKQSTTKDIPKSKRFSVLRQMKLLPKTSLLLHNFSYRGGALSQPP